MGIHTRYPSLHDCSQLQLDMTPPGTSNESAPTRLGALSKSLLFISILLAGVLSGAGFENFMDEGSSWIQVYKAVFPTLIALCVGYVLVKSNQS